MKFDRIYLVIYLVISKIYSLVTNVINKLYSSTGSFSHSQNENPIICESSRKQTCMNDLPEELVIEIFLCLPVKSLLRFKVVCRAWRSHISNPKFVNRHNVRTTTNPKCDYIISCNFHPSLDRDQLCFININPPNRAISLNLPTCIISHHNFYVVGSCNGLLCLDSRPSTKNLRYYQSLMQKLYLWNPATGKAKELPRCNDNIMTEYYDTNGFGFDFASSDYKVVRIGIRKKKKDSWENRVEVYSLKKNSWKNIEVDLDFELLRSTISVMGSLYLIATKLERRSLLSFNMESETFRKIPPLHADKSWIYEIFEFKESVAVSDNVYTREVINIWTLNDDSCWIKMLTINSATIEKMVGYLMTGEFVGLDCDNELVLYDPVNEVGKPIQHRLHTSYNVTTYNYSESLVNLNL